MILVRQLFISLLLLIFIGPSFAADRALLIGIDKYQYVSPLKGSKEDVKAMKSFIRKVWHYKNSQIKVLLDRQATKKAILSAFDNWLIRGTRRGDRAFFFYSGHGYYVWDKSGDEDDGYDETLCPVDTNLNGSSMILDDEIEKRLKKLKGRQVTIIVDACHSGTVTRGLELRKKKKDLMVLKTPVFNNRVLKQKPKEFFGLTRSLKPDGFIASEDSIVAYSAVAPNQVALVDVEKPYGGVFTHNFIEGVEKKLADANHDGKITNAELLEYTRKQSQAYCDRNPRQCKAGALSPQLAAPAKSLGADVRTNKPPRQQNSPQQVSAELTVHDNKAKLSLKVLPHNRFRLGDKMKIQVRSEHSGYLLLFDINSQGHLTRLFPNQFSKQEGKSGYVKAKKTLTVPDRFYGFDFIAEKPLGKGLLVALVVEDELSRIQQLIPDAFTQVRAREAKAVLQQLRQQLNRTLPQKKIDPETGEEYIVNHPVRWSLAVKEYRISR
jgi:hypothetical protein